MDTYKLTLTLEKNGQALPGWNPCIRRLTVDQSQSFDDLLATGSGDVTLPLTAVTLVSFLALTVDQIEIYKPGDITLAAGGLVLIFNGSCTGGTINNASGASATNRGLAGGG
jgi:hypothetical protein